jgi:seryl-tRNA synthetase
MIDLLAALNVQLDRISPPTAIRLRFPGVISRATLTRGGYEESFPDLVGIVSRLTPAESGDELALAPAACYGIYPLLEATCVEQQLQYDVVAPCFRNESARDVGRLRAFTMREFVCVGPNERPSEFLAHYRNAFAALFAALGLDDLEFAVAADPFFGRFGPLLKGSQISQALKHEFSAPVGSSHRAALVSFNDHRQKFSQAFDIRSAPGTGCVIHSACVGIGLERIVLAVCARHGADPRRWPHEVRCRLPV